MDKQILTQDLHAPVSRLELIKTFCHGKDVLDIGCIQHDLDNASNETWLHQAIKGVAASVIGVDYLEEPVAELRRRGYSVVAGDVTCPLPIERQVDVIVIGNLIEHLSNFEGLFENIRRLLKPGGCVLISTANPFYREQYFYSAFKNDILVNPEHTCWIDPVTLDQLAHRFGLKTERVHWVKEKWHLSQIVLNGKERHYNMFTGHWEFSAKPTRFESIVSNLLLIVFTTCFPSSFTKRITCKYGKAGTRRLLFLRAAGMLFGTLWMLYRSIIKTAPINQYELFVSVLRR